MTTLACVNAEFVALQNAECCVGHRALALASKMQCGTVSDAEWEQLYLMDRWLDVIRQSLDTKGCASLAVVGFGGNIVGCKMLVSLNGAGVFILTVLEGDIPGVGDIGKSLDAAMPAIRAFFATPDDWRFPFPLFDVWRVDNSLVLAVHPYYAMYAPNAYPADMADWEFTFGTPFTCDVPVGPPPAEGWLGLAATVPRRFCGGELPLAITGCAGADGIRRMFSKIMEWCGACCGDNAPPETFLAVTSTGDCCCDFIGDSLDGLDSQQIAAYLNQGGIGAMGISDFCHPFTVHS